MTHHDQDQRLNGQNEIYLFVKLKSVSKVHEKNEVEDSDKVADISTISHGIPTSQNDQQLQDKIALLKKAIQTLQNGKQEE